MFYFDMDGVLVKYDIGAYVGNEPTFRKIGRHYFRDLSPEDNMLAAFNKLCVQAPDDVYVLTSVSETQPIRNEQIFDKLYWLTQHAPKFDIGAHFIAATSSKRTTIADIKGMPITKNDVLIDDYNTNLFKWVSAGGTAIKCLNGINSPDSWPGICIDITRDSETILGQLKKIWYMLHVYGKLDNEYISHMFEREVRKDEV